MLVQLFKFKLYLCTNKLGFAIFILLLRATSKPLRRLPRWCSCSTTPAFSVSKIVTKMAWSWRPAMHCIHLFLLVSTVIMVSCWWLWLLTAWSPILWLIGVFYMLLAIMVLVAFIHTMQLLQIPKLIASAMVRATLQFTCSVSLATLIAAAALEQPIVSTSSIASLAAHAIQSSFICIIMIACLTLVPDIDISHRRIRPIPSLVACLTIGAPLLELFTAIYLMVTAVQLAAASHTQVVEPVTVSHSIRIIYCAAAAFSTVIFSMLVVDSLPLPPQI